MRNFILYILSLAVSISAFAESDVTKFLGIPVDGYKGKMISSLKLRGFKPTSVGSAEFLEGRFNGSEVQVFIGTDNGKVSRVMVCDANDLDESSIKSRFNNLCHQFENNGKYFVLDDFAISDDEDISYEMTVHKKRYQAQFYQLPEGQSSEEFLVSIRDKVLSKYTTYELDNLTDELREKLAREVLSEVAESISHKSVWFIISEYYGRYGITMFYDNELNRPHGEDL